MRRRHRKKYRQLAFGGPEKNIIDMFYLGKICSGCEVHFDITAANQPPTINLANQISNLGEIIDMLVNNDGGES